MGYISVRMSFRTIGIVRKVKEKTQYKNRTSKLMLSFFCINRDIFKDKGSEIPSLTSDYMIL